MNKLHLEVLREFLVDVVGIELAHMFTLFLDIIKEIFKF